MSTYSVTSSSRFLSLSTVSDGFAFFVCLVLLSISIGGETIGALATMAYSSPEYSHLLVIVPLSAALMWTEQRAIFANTQRNLKVAAPAIAVWIGFEALAGSADSQGANWRLAISVFVLVTFWIAAFHASFGSVATRRAAFPLMFLLLLVPVPEEVLRVLIAILQHASADAVDWLFRATGIPVLRQGQVFALANLQIEIAKECSGIRSATALFITALIAGHLGLKSRVNKLVFLLATIPLAVAKNGVRIFALSVLAAYVDPTFLSGALHKEGGFVFFGISVLGLFAVLYFLMHRESRVRKLLRDDSPVSGTGHVTF